MTVKDLIKVKDYDRIEYRISVPESLGGGTYFAGACKSENGKLISLDGDSYDENAEIEEYEEFVNEARNIKNGVSIVCRDHF